MIRGRYTIPLVFLVALAMPVQAETPAPRVAPDSLKVLRSFTAQMPRMPVVAFKTQAELSAVIREIILRRSNQDTLDERAEATLKLIQSCTVPDIGSDKVVLYRGPNASPFFTELMRRAMMLPNYGGGKLDGMFAKVREVVCNVSSTQEAAGHNARFDPLAGFTDVPMHTQALAAFMAAFHENVHAVFNARNKELFLKIYNGEKGGDNVAYILLNEANAIWSTLAEMAQKQIKDKTHGGHDDLELAIQDEYGPSTRLLYKLVQLYGKNEVEKTIKETGAFPAAINRVMLAAVMDRLASADGYRKTARDYIEFHDNNTMTLDDKAIIDMMGGVSGKYGTMNGMVDMIKTLPLMLFSDAAAFDAGIDGAVMDDKQPELVTFGLTLFLYDFTTDATCIATAQSRANKLAEKMRGTTYFKSEFARNDWNAIFDGALKRLEEQPVAGSKTASGFTPDVKAGIAELIRGLRSSVMDGKEMPHVQFNDPFKKPTKVQAMNCG